MEDLKVREVMTPGVVTCNPDMTMAEVARLLSDADVSALVVVDQQGQIQGVVSQFDLLQYFGKDLSVLTVREIMSTRILSVLLDDAVKQAAEEMHQKHIHRLVVTNEERTRALGIISATDIIRVMRGLGE